MVLLIYFDLGLFVVRANRFVVGPIDLLWGRHYDLLWGRQIVLGPTTNMLVPEQICWPPIHFVMLYEYRYKSRNVLYMPRNSDFDIWQNSTVFWAFPCLLYCKIIRYCVNVYPVTFAQYNAGIKLLKLWPGLYFDIYTEPHTWPLTSKSTVFLTLFGCCTCEANRP